MSADAAIVGIAFARALLQLSNLTATSLLLRRFKPGSEIDIGMRVRLVHGDKVISDSDTDGGIQGACAKFKAWVRQQYFAGKDVTME
jgi:hypothetical protein